MLHRSHALLVLPLMLACGDGNLASHLVRTPGLDMDGQSKCSAQKRQKRPLIIEWPVSDRVALEARARRGVVAVRYDGCQMEVLTRCTSKEKYGYIGTSLQKDQLEIDNVDDLYAKVPLGAAKLEAKLATSGALSVRMSLVGRYETERPRFSSEDFTGDCSGATHAVVALTAGAFELSAGGKAEIGGGVEVANVGAGAKSKSSRQTLNSAGDTESCTAATRDDEQPPNGCGALIRVEVIELGGQR